MFFRVKDQFQRTRFNLACRDILRTPPLRMRDASVTFISQVSHRDVLMYLIAIKSIYRFWGAGKIAVIDDGSLTRNDREIINRHLPLVRLIHINEVPRGKTPVGGTWERLLTIADLVQDSYVIQTDSDTITLHEIPEVLNNVTENRSFTLLGAGSFPEIEPMLEACNRAKRKGGVSVEPQAISEGSLDKFPNCTQLKYVRGCSGFAGFGQGSFTRVDVERFSRDMEGICGKAKWHEWGSEQVTSNLIVANSASATPLQHPKYTSYYALPEVDYSQSSFIHFMGTHRFENRCYSTFARRVIHELMSEEWKQPTVGHCAAVGTSQDAEN